MGVDDYGNDPTDTVANSTIIPTGTSDNTEEKHVIDAVNHLILSVILILAILVTYFINSRKWGTKLPESGASILFGILIGGVLRLLDLIKLQHEFFFSPEAFYFILLPPIIFVAGYTMNKRNFFLNMGSILLFAVIGTLISTVVFGFFLFGLSKLGVLHSINSDHPLESLMFGALISAIDPVATLSIMGSAEMSVHPVVYSLVFGEAVLNDAVSIVLFRTFTGYGGSEAFGSTELLTTFGKFMLVCFGSVAIGLVVGLLSAIFFKHVSYLRNHTYLEVSLMFLFAYTSYLIAEIVQMSGVMSLFLCGVIMKHYNWYSLSDDAQTTTLHLFTTIAFVAETFVFVYLGINVSSFSFSFEAKWDPVLIFFATIGCFLSRFCNIFPLSFLANFRRKEKITLKMQAMLWFAGLRGAVAFALALNVNTEHRGQIVTTTLFITTFTTLVLGCTTAPMLKKLGLQVTTAPEQEKEWLMGSLNKDEEEEEEGGHEPKHKSVKIKKHMNFIHRTWRIIDDKFMKKVFGGQLRDDLREFPVDM